MVSADAANAARPQPVMDAAWASGEIAAGLPLGAKQAVAAEPQQTNPVANVDSTAKIAADGKTGSPVATQAGEISLRFTAAAQPGMAEGPDSQSPEMRTVAPLSVQWPSAAEPKAKSLPAFSPPAALHPPTEPASMVSLHAVEPPLPGAASMPHAAIGSQSAGHPPAGHAGAGQPAATFAALDAQPAAGQPVWVHAGAQRAEGGFQDPALGWVGVRAENSGGGIHAVITPESAQAVQVLGAHMAGLNLHLADRHLPVETLLLQTDASGSGGAQQRNPQQGQAETGARAGSGATLLHRPGAVAVASSTDHNIFVPPLPAGVTISVMA